MKFVCSWILGIQIGIANTDTNQKRIERPFVFGEFFVQLKIQYFITWFMFVITISNKNNSWSECGKSCRIERKKLVESAAIQQNIIRTLIAFVENTKLHTNPKKNMNSNDEPPKNAVLNIVKDKFRHDQHVISVSWMKFAPHSDYWTNKLSECRCCSVNVNVNVYYACLLWINAFMFYRFSVVFLFSSPLSLSFLIDFHFTLLIAKLQFLLFVTF